MTREEKSRGRRISGKSGAKDDIRTSILLNIRRLGQERDFQATLTGEKDREFKEETSAFWAPLAFWHLRVPRSRPTGSHVPTRARTPLSRALGLFVAPKGGGSSRFYVQGHVYQIGLVAQSLFASAVGHQSPDGRGYDGSCGS